MWCGMVYFNGECSSAKVAVGTYNTLPQYLPSPLCHEGSVFLCVYLGLIDPLVLNGIKTQNV